MELGGTKAFRLEDGSAPRGSSRASRADVRSNHGGGFASIAPSEERGPRRFLWANFSNYFFAVKSASKFPPTPPRPKNSYHLNVFRGPPGLPRLVGFFPATSTSAIDQTDEVGHSSTEQRLVTIATFEHAHDSTLRPLIGKCTDISRETIENRGWNPPIVPRH
jgi:hypothetical protein